LDFAAKRALIQGVGTLNRIDITGFGLKSEMYLSMPPWLGRARRRRETRVLVVGTSELPRAKRDGSGLFRGEESRGGWDRRPPR